MAFTVASLYSNVTLTAAAETTSNYAKVDLSAFAFNGLTIEIKLTNGAIPPVTGRQIQVYFAFSSLNLNTSTDNIAAILRNSARIANAPTRPEASAVVGTITHPIAATAQYLYAWVTHDTLSQAVRLDASYIGFNFVPSSGGGSDIGALLIDGA